MLEFRCISLSLNQRRRQEYSFLVKEAGAMTRRVSEGRRVVRHVITQQHKLEKYLHQQHIAQKKAELKVVAQNISFHQGGNHATNPVTPQLTSTLSMFEQLVRDARVGRSKYTSRTIGDDRNSCGNTVQCYASLFSSNEQARVGYIYQMCAGGLFQQIRNNPNLSLTFLLSRIPTSLVPKEVWLPMVDKWSRERCRDRMSRFFSLLHSVEEEELLPRIFACSTSWIDSSVSPPDFSSSSSLSSSSLSSSSSSSSSSLPPSPSSSLLPSFSSFSSGVVDGYIGDHEFILIKHGNGHYQIIQGYKDTVLTNQEIKQQKDKNISLGTMCDGQEAGYGLTGWQASGNMYSSLAGFDRSALLSFQGHMNKFATDERWDAENHYAMNSMRVDGILNMPYIPSFSSREICKDQDLTVWGDLPLSAALVEWLDAEASRAVE